MFSLVIVDDVFIVVLNNKLLVVIDVALSVVSVSKNNYVLIHSRCLVPQFFYTFDKTF